MVMEFCRPLCEDGPEYGAASICMEQACDVQPEACGADSGPVPEYGMIQVYGMRIFLIVGCGILYGFSVLRGRE